MKLLDEIRLLEGQSESARIRKNNKRRNLVVKPIEDLGLFGQQQRGSSASPNTGGRVLRQGIRPPRTTAGIMRRQVMGNPPPGTMPLPGEKFETDDDKEQARNWLAGKSKQGKLKFESRLLEALYSDPEFLIEAVKRQRPVRAGMSKTKKWLIGGALAAALAAGIGSGGKKSGDASLDSQGDKTHKPASMGQGRVTTDKDLDILPGKRKRFDPSKPGPVGQGPDPSKSKKYSSGKGAEGHID